MNVTIKNPGNGQQLELQVAPLSPVDPNIMWLENLLHGAGRWMMAKDIAFTTGGRVIDRDIRDYASASEWIISGQKGYKHITHATVEEINHACSWLESQARKMNARARRLRDNSHRILK